MDLSERVKKLQSILDVAKLLTAERDLDSLLDLILRHAASVAEADRCSLFILDRDKGELWSKIAQGGVAQIRLPLGSGIAGAVAQTGEVINLQDAYADPRFRHTFDQATGYRTRTIVCVPMRNARGEITGVLQALNKGRGAFTEEDAELLLALGGQAAGAIENAVLHEDIQRLFEGFVSASVMAIEARDPSTAGHSGRVATLTLELARAAEGLARGPHAGTRFSPVQMQELRYASLLHDFGKVGVREAVLVKAEKLHPAELELLRARFDLARKDRQLQSFQARLEAVKARGEQAIESICAQEDQRLSAALGELDEVLAFVLACNRPTVLEKGGFERLAALRQLSFNDSRGQKQPLLLSQETEALSIPKGSLSALERKEIEHHVTDTFRFLSQIPWTRDLKRVPDIAYAHHEKLNGQGYPRGLTAKDIPIQSKIMAICDIYDALTAADRPYKKAVPHQKALDILKTESSNGQLDVELFQLFVEAEVPRKAAATVSPKWCAAEGC